ncbi:hypothetical protein G9A89_000559, partial [Geosiphon pyriformis]
MDTKQMKPIEGIPPLMSLALLAFFDFFAFHFLLRCLDKYLLEIQKISRMSKEELQEEGVEEHFKDLVRKYCTFVPSITLDKLSTVPGTIYCYPKHEACHKVERQVISFVKRCFQDVLVSRKSVDREQARLANFASPASKVTRRTLDVK